MNDDHRSDTMEFRDAVRGRLEKGLIASVQAAFKRYSTEGRLPEAKIIFDELFSHLGPTDRWIQTVQVELNLHNDHIEQDSVDEISFSELCSASEALQWINRSWLEDMVGAIWDQCGCRHYVAPLQASVLFPIGDQQFHKRTQVRSLRFVEDSAMQVRVRFDLTDGRFAILTLRRDRPPKGMMAPLEGVLTLLAVAAYRDCVVADTPSIRRSGCALLPKILPTVTTSLSASTSPTRGDYVVPRVGRWRRASRPGIRVERNPAMVTSVVGHVRWLPPGREASAYQIAEALRHGIVLAPDQTFVRGHVRGGSKSGNIARREATSRLLASQLAGSLTKAVRWS